MRFLVASGIACAAGASLTTTDTVVSESPRWLARVRRVTGLSFSGARFKGRRSVASLLVGCQKGNCLVSSFYSRFLARRPQGAENKALRVLQGGERNVLVNRWTSRLGLTFGGAALQRLRENRKRNSRSLHCAALRSG